MSISEAILFIASNSKACRPCIQFVSQHHIPMEIVRLDTEAARKSAASGNFFQVTIVPTMVIVYNDGNTQLFIGAEKITGWLSGLLKSNRQPTPAPQPPREQNMYGPISSSYNIARTRKPVIEEGEDLDEQEIYAPPPPRPQPRRAPIVVEEDYPEPEEIEEEYEEPPEPPKPKSKSKKGKSRKPVEQEDSVAGKRKLAKEKLNKAASAKSKQLSSKMKDVYNTAKQMEEDMKNSLGYKEEELPHY